MMKRMDRRWSQFTREDIQKIADATPVEKYTYTWLSRGDYMPPFSDRLSGKEVKILLDGGEQYLYRFTGKNELKWSGPDGEVHEEYYEALEAPGEEEIYMVQHYCRKSAPPGAHTLVLDFRSGLVTMCIATVGVPRSAREVGREFLFGIMDGFEDCGKRHGFTEELVGRSILWTYHEKEQVKVKHIYTAPLYYTYIMTGENGSCWVASNPADYVKINDHMYIFSFVEERQAGTQGFFLINMELLHDVGSFFGVQAHGMECCTFGAKGEMASPYGVELCEKSQIKEE